MTASKPAFPSAPMHGVTEEYQHIRDGMSMRQYYKAAALTGLIAASANGLVWPTEKDTATMASRYADALLREDAEFEGRKE